MNTDDVILNEASRVVALTVSLFRSGAVHAYAATVVDGVSYAAVWECHPVDVALDSTDWAVLSSLSEEQQSLYCDIVRSGVQCIGEPDGRPLTV